MQMSENKSVADEQWENYYNNQRESRTSQWPNEIMLRLVFGSYLKNTIPIKNDSKILDIGCGTGNNLLPFLLRGCECYGTEVTEETAKNTASNLQRRGLEANIQCGKNTSLPFADKYFDLALSINVLHYEEDDAGIKAALREYHRVLKPDGVLLLITASGDHDIYKKSKALGNNQYLIQDWDFRDGESFFFFTNTKNMQFHLDSFWSHIEVGEVKEQLMEVNTGFLLAVCSNT
jgi:SAM-dependent methyltransferase